MYLCIWLHEFGDTWSVCDFVLGREDLIEHQEGWGWCLSFFTTDNCHGVSLGTTWPSCPSWPCASRRVCGCTPRLPASPAAVPRTLCSQMAGSSPKVPTMTRGGGSWSERGPVRQGGTSPDWSLLFHRCCLPHWYFRDPPQPICVARPWGDASPTPYLHHLCSFPFGDPRRAQGSGKSDITPSPL